ncbi:fatty acid synthase-like [Watersipora subatra]|uniref:fatty acid synthase-like n=1 Tax=Watersipora subatra TaxID=2589382 RepID=UPI00355C3B28
MPAIALCEMPVGREVNRLLAYTQRKEQPKEYISAMQHASHWQRSCDDEIVITGISCRLPESDNVNEFRDHLMNNDDMVTDDDRRWTSGIHGLPSRSGKLKDLSKFDATFFGVHAKQAARMDPQLRMLLEVTFEAIVDSGTNPESLRGSNTGVFVGTCDSEAADSWCANASTTEGFTMIGIQRGMFSNRLSYFFDFKGPSFTVDTACSSSLLAMDQALLAIRTGQCDSAIVAGASICIKPSTTVQFHKLSMLSPDGACKAFDESGDGYVRSEGIVAIFLQKQKNSKRIYAHLIHSKSNSDGAKEDNKSITYPSGQMQKALMKQVYEECGIRPRDISYIEAHGTGTKAGDPEEVNAIAELFCKGRDDPLLIGSTKSNIGHSEPASGLASLTKVLICSEEGTLAANLHYKHPNSKIPALRDGRLRVVSENTGWDGGLMAINSFGFGGTNVHSVLNTKVAQAKEKSNCQELRLLTYCGRTEESLECMFETVNTQHSKDVELFSLLSQSSDQSCVSQPYRGYTILNHPDHQIMDIKVCSRDNRKLWYIFTGMGCQWYGMARDLMQLDTFAQSISMVDEYLRPYNIELSKLFTGDDSTVFDNIINSFVSIAAIQVALVDTLSVMGLTPDGVIGHSVGELGCGYADGSLTAQETVLAAYWRGRCVLDANLEPGAMAAVGLTWQEAKIRCPEGVVPACHNAEKTVTISGPVEAVRNFVTELKNEGCFAKEVSSNGIAFHSNDMVHVAPKLKDCLFKVIKAKKRHSKWVSTSVPVEHWGSALHQYSSADYHANNLVSPVLFQEALTFIPADAVTVEIAPHALLQALLKRSLSPDSVNIGLQKKNCGDNLNTFFEAIGKLYQVGFNPKVSALYNPVSYPVSRGTPSISSLIHWDHSISYDVPTEKDFEFKLGENGCGRVAYSISLEDSQENVNRYLVGHMIDGRILYPATGYLVLAWKTLALSLGQEYTTLPVRFDNIAILEATMLQKEGEVVLLVSLLPSTGAFEVIENDKVKASGQIRAISNGKEALFNFPSKITSEVSSGIPLDAEDVYQDLRLRGYEYEGQFQGILQAMSNGDSSWLKWDNDWISFLDTMLQVAILRSDDRSLQVPTRISNVRIDPGKLVPQASCTGVEVITQPALKLIQTAGVQIFGLCTTAMPRRKSQKAPVLQTYEFVANERKVTLTPYLQDYLDCCVSAARSKLKCLDGQATALEVPMPLIQQLSELPSSKRDVATPADIFLRDQKFVLLNCLHTIGKNSIDSRHGLVNVTDDLLLRSIFAPEYSKPALDLVFEDRSSNQVKFIELVRSSQSPWYQEVLAFCDNTSQVCPEYTVWLNLNDDAAAHTNPRVSVTQSEYSIKQLPATDYDLVLGSHLFQVDNGIELAKQMLRPGGFLLTVEYNAELKAMVQLLNRDFQLVYQVEDPVQTLMLWRVIQLEPEEEEISVSGVGTSWLEPLKKKLASLTSTEDKRLWIVADDANGVIGLVNCLRLEMMGAKLRCILNAGPDKLPPANSPEMRRIKEKDLVMNVFKKGIWGSYKYLPMQTGKLSSQWANVNHNPSKSGLSSLCWMEAPTKHSEPGGSFQQLCTTGYAALNFRDVMLATGKLAPESIPGYEKMRDCLLGIEFSGWCSPNNRRVMGLCSAKALATTVRADERFLWDVPENWTMSEAATVPVVYSSAYYALIVRGRLRTKESVLIHSGSGGVGQAAIAIALSLDCQVFTTVSSEEKQNFLLSRYPKLKKENILNSRSQMFEFDVMRLTNGDGVQVVLNSLSEDMLQASLRVLSLHGRFLELGKFDLSNNSSLGMAVFLKNTSFHGILLDSLFDEDNIEWEEVRQLVSSGIKSGVVTPLKYTKFGKYQLEEAFRFMANGKHIGKVLIQVKDELFNQTEAIDVLPRFFCHPEKSYLIVGGLGGFGLELAQWLASRGAKKLVLTSRSGVKNGYQAKILKQLRCQKVNVITSTRNAACYTEAEKLLQECINIGPLGGVFNLAAVLGDAIVGNQTESSLKAVLEPKVTSTLNLDSLTRELTADSLDCFVVFSSVVAAIGNKGQINYGFANSAIERMCEKRYSDGLPGLAIQWGAIADVGLVISNHGNNSTVVSGTFPQRIFSCLMTLDKLLCHRNTAVVASYLVAEKKSTSTIYQKDVVKTVFNILGMSEDSSVNSQSTLGSLGLDSLMAAEVKQVLEKEFNLNFTAEELRVLSIDSLKSAAEALPQSEQDMVESVN